MMTKFKVLSAIVTLIVLTGAPVYANTEGWASQTGFRKAETAIQSRIASAARSAATGTPLSPFSTTYGSWQTDTAGGDGTRMRAAINDYASLCYWRTGCNVTQVRSKMFGEFASSLYGTTQKNELIDRIIGYFQSVRIGPPFIPSTDEQTLQFFGVRKQCFEWVQTVAVNAGGKSRAYGSTAVTDQSKMRPGMGLYRTDSSHAMVIVDIYWNSNGTIRKFLVADSNYGSGWTNPKGERPWDRHLRLRDGETMSGNKVVSFE
jgi:hypothetical protein